MKKGISFRFEPDVIESINLGSEISGSTKTNFVAEAITLLTDILELERFRGMDLQEIRAQILSGEKQPVSQRIKKWSERPPGYILDIIFEYLKKNKGVLKSTTQIANDLSIPKSTTRAYVRKLLKKYNGMLELREGRPNQIRYIGD